jgi:transposase
VRHLADLPWHGIPVYVELQSRRFFCTTPGCSRRIFTERLPQTAPSHGRCTQRLSATHRKIAHALGGRAGADLAAALGLAASGDTLLRRLTVREEGAPVAMPRCLGVDEWAWRKGRKHYGTLLCDLERGSVVDLLPERSVESLAAWLVAHPGVEVVSRDRSPLYAEGARQGAPDAVQVADRFHLLRNLSHALQKILEREHGRLRRAAREVARRAAPLSPPADPAPRPPRATEQRKQQNRARRHALYDEVVELRRAGLSHVAIARRVGRSRKTVLRWLAHGAFPERKERAPRQRLLDPFLPYLRQRWSEGVTNASLLFREIRSQGYTGTSYSLLRDQVAGWRRPGWSASADAARALGSVRQNAWILVLPEEKRTPEQRAYLEQLEELWPEVRELEQRATAFLRLFEAHDGAALEPWIRAAEPTPLGAFARGLRSDLEAVRAAIVLPWSNGPTEGHINRLKMLKRQMYGRAGFALLRARVLAA